MPLLLGKNVMCVAAMPAIHFASNRHGVARHLRLLRSFGTGVRSPVAGAFTHSQWENALIWSMVITKSHTHEDAILPSNASDEMDNADLVRMFPHVLWKHYAATWNSGGAREEKREQRLTGAGKTWRSLQRERRDTLQSRPWSGSAPYRGRLAGERESSSLARIRSGCAAAESICLDVSEEQLVGNACPPPTQKSARMRQRDLHSDIFMAPRLAPVNNRGALQCRALLPQKTISDAGYKTGQARSSRACRN